MGCGRSTLGSDSPKKNKKNEADSDCESDGDSGSSAGSSSRKQQLSNKKVSDSQHDFFMMLDEKIENGPDYDSETEEVERRRRLQEYADQWMTLTNTRAMSPTSNSAVRLPDEDTCGSGDITEDDEDDDGLNEPGRIPDEAVREQYMFMGNLYTLTHIRTDTDKTEPKVDVVTVPKQCPVEETSVEDSELGHKLNGSAVPEESEAKENGVAEDGGTASRPPSRPPSKSSSRPASLILRSVFPADTVQE
ncbi:uncharacterized protein LOC121861205 isoform X2 [Homarus americanus]|uniref:uncharacterized protein LOC121861205 isoform X2 n=1 Tax=Homarus americanus TaxID=6706 RepID=UPI001C46D343|nr:uncharacterized protein LOC121861205 isoform X2 [Homarus americanus]